MTTIIGIAGKKQAGKNTVANILHGMVLKRIGFVTEFDIGEGGELLIQAPSVGNGQTFEVFDVSRKDAAFTEFADKEMWPYIKLYSYADMLKLVCTTLFDIPEENVYGTDEQKNTVMPHLLWENMPGVVTPIVLDTELHDSLMGMTLHDPGPMTAREVLQFFGTDICRKMWTNVWVHCTINRILEEQPLIATISDVRFPNEVKAIKEAGGIVIKLTRAIHEDSHSSENQLDDPQFDQKEFDMVIDNHDCTIQDLKQYIINLFQTAVDQLNYVERD